ncbi:MAG: sugar phosphate isomerase/epimerase family protein, partial [Armatimonadota bacterium]|nr:sugar phosphate isomerase/epimerase family protein [Armatimonadota bacterium]
MEKIAIMLGNLKMDPYEGMKVVANLGVPGVHLSVGGGPFAPEKMDLAARRALLRHLHGLGLEISALSAWGGNVDLCEAEKAAENVAWGKRILDLAVDLECRIWQAHIGVLPRDTSDPRWQVVVENAGALAAYGEQVGACLAIETGPEPPAVLERLIKTLNESPGLRINYDPANLILWPKALADRQGVPYDRQKAWEEFEPVEGVKRLGKYIVHTHAKDALVHENGPRQEVPLGSGWIDWPYYVSLLRQQGYNGYFAIERETGADPVGDI